MLSRSLLRSARSVNITPASSARSPSARLSSTTLRSASLFTASIGLGACPKRRRKQSNAETGEDAYFINTTDKTTAWAGVFDGVGGWADMGVDPSVFSAGLARHCGDASAKSPRASPVQVLNEGYNAVQRDVEIQLGSSTACVAVVNLEDGELRVANLGDSGYILVDSNGNVLHASQPQTYFFNAPYQLAKMPDAMRKPGSLENKPKDASLSSHTLQPTHFAILATDGFFDNVFAEDAAKQVKTLVQSTKGDSQALVTEIARALTETARAAGRSKKDGPFAAEAKAHRLRYDGGKEDDICVVVMAISPDTRPIKSKL